MIPWVLFCQILILAICAAILIQSVGIELIKAKAKAKAEETRAVWKS